MIFNIFLHLTFINMPKNSVLLEASNIQQSLKDFELAKKIILGG